MSAKPVLAVSDPEMYCEGWMVRQSFLEESHSLVDVIELKVAIPLTNIAMRFVGLDA